MGFHKHRYIWASVKPPLAYLPCLGTYPNFTLYRRGVQNRKNIIPVFTGISEKIPVRTGKYRYYRSNGIFFIPIPTLAVLPLVNGIHFILRRNTLVITLVD